ncbi:MAG: hypothetical protein U5Q03_15725 [Bacteroidota bacterium]|nr:hypothetical protein [Bacteroidota bacterium]
MKNLFFLVLSAFLFSSCTESLYFGKFNQKDKEGKKKGVWITWWDEEETIPMTKYWYKDGKEQWDSKTYHNNGNKAVKFKKRGDRILVKYFDRFNHLTHKGWARYEVSEVDVHYYWHGEWKYFDEDRRLIKRVIYENGKMKDRLETKEKADQSN